jgi:hypothetical protein
MKYYLKRRAIDPQTIIEIEEERYTLLANARKALVDAGAFEQRYEMLLGNFLAFEMFCAQVSVRGAIEHDFRYETWAVAISEANRHAINFLTTARQYADHVVRDFEHISMVETFSVAAKRLLSEAYDSTLEYRFVCELRNYGQHRATVVHGIKARSNENTWAEASMVNCHKQQILEDRGKFKQKVLDELDENIDLLFMFRRYIVAVSTVQWTLRKIIAETCETARRDTKVALSEFAAAQIDERNLDSAAIGLTAVRSDDGNSFVDEVPLLLEWDDVRVAIAQKNSRRIRLDHPDLIKRS